MDDHLREYDENGEVIWAPESFFGVLESLAPLWIFGAIALVIFLLGLGD